MKDLDANFLKMEGYVGKNALRKYFYIPFIVVLFKIGVSELHLVHVMNLLRLPD